MQITDTYGHTTSIPYDLTAFLNLPPVCRIGGGEHSGNRQGSEARGIFVHCDIAYSKHTHLRQNLDIIIREVNTFYAHGILYACEDNLSYRCITLWEGH